ncbi:conjugative transposon protein TraM [Mucilaginibacter sp. dw_454]|uniref:conjugative transposon protein TraM n=1 Tax=Mucilaginibacter sp. dw_454 TaxID=2720079 RepID=UPI001BD5BAC1|nr:conjugative transposon protein TraM [Mucilaginibacter sp. dw_454]
MAINFKQPRYILPLILLPFLCLFFYVFHAKAEKQTGNVAKKGGIQDNVGEVSSDVRKKSLTDKLDAFRNTYKETDGNTAVSPITDDNSKGPVFTSRYSALEKARLDSIDNAMKAKFNVRTAAPKDQAFAQALNNWKAKNSSAPVREKAVEKSADPMQLFKTQMAYMDSMSKVADPEYKAEQAKKKEVSRIADLKAKEVSLPVSKSDVATEDFNTVMPRNESSFISAMIDENVTGYAGSRIRLRLLEEIKAGKFVVPKGTYLYAEINGFSGQRVTLLVRSILLANQILPVKLEVYDMDGLPGLFVPNSAFRDFTKDLGGNSMQGVNITNGSETGSQLLMSSVDKVFQSTSSAIASAIRKNKAKIKYNSYIYLIDPQALQNSQKSY